MDRITLIAEIRFLRRSLDAAWEPRNNKNVRAAWLFATLTNWLMTAKISVCFVSWSCPNFAKRIFKMDTPKRAQQTLTRSTEHCTKQNHLI